MESLSQQLENIRIHNSDGTPDIEDLFSVTASTFGTFYQHGCARYLRQKSLLEPRGGISIQPLAARRGLIWENDIVNYLGKDLIDCTGKCGITCIRERLDMPFSDPSTPVYLYQPSFAVLDDDFTREFRNQGVKFGRMLPDFLEFRKSNSGEETWIVRIIDAKATPSIKISHQMQVSFYAFFLSRLFQFHFGSKVIVDTVGEIWLRKESATISECIETFSLLSWNQIMNRDFRRILKDTFCVEDNQVQWQLKPSCATCPYLNDCRRRGQNDVRSLPYISSSDSKFLCQIAVNNDSQITSEKIELSNLKQRILSSEPFTQDRARRILGSSDVKDSFGKLDSLLDNRVILTNWPYGLFPKVENISCAISISIDNFNDLPYAWGVSLGIPTNSYSPPADIGTRTLVDNVTIYTKTVTVDRSNDDDDIVRNEKNALCMLVTHLSKIIAWYTDLKSNDVKVQFYCWDATEKMALTSSLLKATQDAFQLPHDSDVMVKAEKLCTLLLDGKDIWMLDSPTSNITDSQLHTSSSIGRLTANHLSLAADLDTSIARGSKGIAAQKVIECSTKRNEAISTSTPIVCDVLLACRKLLYYPSMGLLQMSDLPGCEQLKECLEMEELWVSNNRIDQNVSNKCIQLLRAKDWLRNILTGRNDLLYNEAPVIDTTRELRRHDDPIIQRLIFLKHMDVIYRCTNARQVRAELACSNNAVALVYKGSYRDPQTNAFYNMFAHVGGPSIFPDMELDQRSFLGKWVLTDSNRSTAVQFLDIQHISERVYSGNLNLTFATIRLVESKPASNEVIIYLEIPYQQDRSLNLRVDSTYYLFERATEMNVQKILSFLRIGVTQTFVNLVRDPMQWSGAQAKDLRLSDFTGEQVFAKIQRLNTFYNEQRRLQGDSFDKVLSPLRGNQLRAFERLLFNRLTLVWGPPGTGKTTFASKSILNLIEAISALSKDKSVTLRVLVSAFTHTAIDNMLRKFSDIAKSAASIANRQDLDWVNAYVVHKLGVATSDLNDVETSNVLELFASHRFVVVGATVWEIQKSMTKMKEAFDLVFCDEASQMQVAESSLPIACLKPTCGRLVIVGDSLQLAPIYAFKFPKPPPGIPPMHTSILECLTRGEDGKAVNLLDVAKKFAPAPSTLVMLQENFRMNGPLSKFTSRIYGDDYKPHEESRNRSGEWKVKSNDSTDGSAVRRLLGNAIENNKLNEMVAIRLLPVDSNGRVMQDDELSLTSQVSHLNAEGHCVAQVLRALSRSHARLNEDDVSSEIYVCTPHRKQRSAVFQALRREGQWNGKVDTVERMQGQESNVVVICLGIFDRGTIENEADFLFSIERLNVAISRAKQSCILIYTDAIMSLNPDVIACPERNAAYSHLKAFVDGAVQIDLSVDII